MQKESLLVLPTQADARRIGKIGDADFSFAGFAE